MQYLRHSTPRLTDQGQYSGTCTARLCLFNIFPADLHVCEREVRLCRHLHVTAHDLEESRRHVCFRLVAPKQTALQTPCAYHFVGLMRIDRCNNSSHWWRKSLYRHPSLWPEVQRHMSSSALSAAASATAPAEGVYLSWYLQKRLYLTILANET